MSNNMMVLSEAVSGKGSNKKPALYGTIYKNNKTPTVVNYQKYQTNSKYNTSGSKLKSSALTLSATNSAYKPRQLRNTLTKTMVLSNTVISNATLTRP